MQISQLYISKITSKIIFQCLIWVLLIVIIVDWVSQTQKLSNNYHLLDTVYYVLLMLPNRLQLCLPVIMLVSGALLAQHLHKSQEWLALQTLGCSYAKIITTLAITSGAILLICYCLIETVGYKSLFKAKQLRSNKENVFLSSSGLWWWENTHNGQEKSFNHIEKINKENKLKNIIIISLSEQGKPYEITTAQTARYQNKHWTLTNVNHKNLASGNQSKQKNASIDWKIKPSITKILSQKDRMLSLANLYHRWQFAKQSLNKQATLHGYNLFHRIYSPIFSLLCFLLPWCCCMTNLRSTRDKSKLLLSISIGITIFIIDILAKPFSQLVSSSPQSLTLLPSILTIITMLVFNLKHFKR